ncbi:ankyrin repeat domain-containing protein [Candidatus Babeliales bacterium]|nr:ankyrin repeat domain-containing protein [Candidatus Babeliales bacterium]
MNKKFFSFFLLNLALTNAPLPAALPTQQCVDDEMPERYWDTPKEAQKKVDYYLAQHKARKAYQPKIDRFEIAGLVLEHHPKETPEEAAQRVKQNPHPVSEPYNAYNQALYYRTLRGNTASDNSSYDYDADIELVGLMLEHTQISQDDATEEKRIEQLSRELQMAIDKASCQELQELIDAGADINFDSGYLLPPLHQAAGAGRIDHVELLLRNGANPNKKFFDVGDVFKVHSFTPLMIALTQKRAHCAQLLLQAGANVFEIVPGGNTILHIALAMTSILDILSVKQNQKETWEGVYTILVSITDPEVRKKLINTPNDLGQTPLHLAAKRLNLECAQLLMDHGANINAVDCNGNNGLHYAVQAKEGLDTSNENHTTAGLSLEAKVDNMVAYLLWPDFSVNDIFNPKPRDPYKKININAQNKAGETALLLASKVGWWKPTQTLLKAGANKTIKDHAGNTYQPVNHPMCLIS